MSKICIMFLKKNELTSEESLNSIKTIFERNNLFCFFDIDYTEPFFTKFEHSKYSILSISDNKNYDNCEMFLVPDNCYINGKKSNSLFCDRMNNLKNILASCFDFTSEMHLIIGDSGVLFDEFIHLSIKLDEFCLYAQNLNSISAPDIHFIITAADQSGNSKDRGRLETTEKVMF